MNPKVKRGIQFILVFVCFVGVFFWIEVKKNAPVSEEDPDTAASETMTAATNESSESRSTSDRTDQTGTSESEPPAADDRPPLELEETEVLEDFADKWLNYQNLYARNQAVRDLLTNQCIKNKDIDINPNVEMESKGTLLSISKDLKEDDLYLVMAEEELSETRNQIFLAVRIEKESKRIQDFYTIYVKDIY